MNTEKDNCNSCGESILLTTKTKTGGLCMPCDQKKKREERAAYIKANKKEVDPFQGITDPVEILQVMHRKKRYDPLIVEKEYPKSRYKLTASLHTNQLDKLMQKMITLASGEFSSQAISLASTIKRSTSYPLGPLLRLILDQELDCYEDFIFHGADSEIRDKLISNVESDPDKYLTRLAWIGDSTVVDQFNTWRKNSPPWKDEIYWEPHEYAQTAGWELTNEGSKRELCFKTCLPLKKGELSSQSKDCLATTIGDSYCPACNKQAINLLDLETRNIDWLSSTERLKFSTCELCVLYSDFTISSKHGNNWAVIYSNPQFLPDNQNEEYPRDKVLKLGEERNCFYAIVEELHMDDLSQIGGYPNWQQDPIYPLCQNCDQKMMFFSQLDGTIFDGPVGFFYCFICNDCNQSTATVFQTT